MRLVEDASGRRLYICLRCGNKFWSRAKKPQCSVCKSKRVMLYEDFLKLPQEKQEEILGKRKQESGEKVEAAGVKDGETGGKSVKEGEVSPGEGVKMGESPGENGGNKVKMGDSPKITQNPPVKKGDSPKVSRVKSGDKKGEKVKGERVKRFSLPRPKLSWKVYAVGVGLAFAYYLYKVGWFDEMFRHLKRLGALKDAKEEDKPVVRSSPVLGKIESNLRRG
ncbi:hypothetical protein [Thermococcus celericrescens]|uniref:hypothetical protein n=1 Tax=Thermococcus celericrescens TaxID=227598 RepID=UPI001FE16462|nr:hypothetical protein [Thermococcus celericrescens]